MSALARSPEPAAEDLAAVARLQVRSVAVITAGSAHPVGFCATSLAPVSSRPLTLSFAIDRTTRSWATVRRAAYVLVHLLGRDQQDLALNFARRREDKFGPEIAWHRGAYGLPQLDGVLACLVLAVEQRFPFDASALIVGRVVDATRDETQIPWPLLHHRGDFVGI